MPFDGRHDRRLRCPTALTVDRYADATPFPERLTRITELALDLWWSWDRNAREVFRQLDYPLWRATAHNRGRQYRP
jgi:hypothetical protein